MVRGDDEPMRLSDAFSGLLLLLFGAGVVAYAASFPATPGQGIGPGLFPMLAGGGMAACGALLAWGGVRKRGIPWLEFEDWVRRPRMVLNAALVIGALISYAVAAETAGFFITAVVLLVLLFLAFEVSGRWIAPLALGVTLGLHVMFYTLLRVPLPWGWLEGIAW